ncbi:S-adenosylmethionine:tRNA ribosyltransferase-isomerase [Marivirga sp. S37H4]|uniref:S-adenosylmethionine:tRNA ribosyltransferase-isomerase n=1 Tax=Marivirga aurantiaca TaxID=2802615 RepID=A0A934WW75_9BACT|nr:S-adenosylmethionine:tRNA ribosyltransferase-isomerase [Marivirga aurantiaca]MBK6264198.1 S-adenosylmethionine:tRNA ribosyltransferase-isomerase [Marivirga aurantiaca]
MPDLLEKASKINLQEYKYQLKEERIAKFPLAERDQAKLLLYQKGEIQHQRFFEINEFLPENSTLFFNNTKVIPARIHFQKQTGATIEIFLLSAVLPTTEIAEAMLVKGKCVWHCMVGNRKRWKTDDILVRFFDTKYGKIKVIASYADFEKNHIQFEWDNLSVPFVEIVEMMGTTPLPPYLNRKATEEDKPRYQTVYSKNEGAVAAPTAGLHFTDKIIEKLKTQSHHMEYLTLHVGAGTFQPIKSENVLEHPMHCEQIQIEKSTIEFLTQTKQPIIAVGTTSVRSLESAYWFGVQLINNVADKFHIHKLLPYETGFENLPDIQTAFKAILDYLNRKNLNTLYGDTEIFIFPGYQFQVINGLITNFHQPESTLMLLIAALLGDEWKRVYTEALNNDYRFLSYGDSSLLIP